MRTPPWPGDSIAALPRIRLVAIVRDRDQLLIGRDHETAPWRLPATPWPPAVNPVAALRELLSEHAGLIVSPVLSASVRLSATAGLLVFTTHPLNASPLVATRGYRWLDSSRIRTVIPPGDQHLLSLTASPHTQGPRLRRHRVRPNRVGVATDRGEALLMAALPAQVAVR